MQNERPAYQAYLLRIWTEGKVAGCTRWLCSLQDVQTRQRRGFDNLDALFAFIEGSVRKSAKGEGNDRSSK